MFAPWRRRTPVGGLLVGAKSSWPLPQGEVVDDLDVPYDVRSQL